MSPPRRRRDTLVVGYCPVPRAPGDAVGVAFVGTDSGRRLAKYCGLSDDLDLLDHFDLVNLFRSPDAGTRMEGRRRAHALWNALVLPLGYPTVVLCSTLVAEAFGVAPLPWLTWRDVSGVRVGTIPHPSGLTRNWNDPEFVDRARAFLVPTLVPA